MRSWSWRTLHCTSTCRMWDTPTLKHVQLCQGRQKNVRQRRAQMNRISTPHQKSFLLKIADVCQRCNPFTGSKIKNDLEFLDIGFRLCSLHTILQQEVLLREDVELIELLDPSVLQSAQAQQQQNGRPPSQCLPVTPNIWDVSVLAAIVSILVVTPNFSDSFPWVTFGMSLFGLALYMVFRSFSLWKIAKLQRCMRKCSVSLGNIVENSCAFTSLVRKTLRQIQETEVISRGFTMVTAGFPLNKLGSSWQQQGQQLIGLRKAVYRSLRAAYRVSRMTTCQMLKSYPLNSEIDNVTNYLSTIPLKELGMGLCEEPVTDEEVQELTDGYSLQVLKVLFQLWIGQNSECFRRLALLLSPAQIAHKPHILPEHFSHHTVSDIVHDLPPVLTRCLEELKRSYEFHRYFEIQQRGNLATSSRTKKQTHSRELNNMYASVRSLHLHLKALLNQVIALEDDLERFIGSGEQQEITSELCHALKQKLKLIQPHMHGTISCWEDATTQVDKLGHKSTDNKGRLEAEDDNLLPVWNPPAIPLVQIENRDPVPEEQELEAYVEESDSDGEFRRDTFDYLSPEKREKEKQEREESRRMLHELKNVLGFKASELERQKWKQLLFNDHAALKTMSPPAVVEQAASPENLQDMGASEQERKECEGSPQQAHGPKPDTSGDCKACCKTIEAKNIDVYLTGESKDTNLSEAEQGSEVDGNSGYCLETMDIDHGALNEEENWQTVLSEEQQTAVKERLAGLHSPASISFTQALAAQVAAQSHTFTHLQEQTFGDD
eukprot:gi/632980849/ref/XP_007907264.1/ PREDICTED: vezatin [Callorhinchus milii]